MIHQSSFQFHVDAEYYGFQWTNAMYMEVEYAAVERDGKVTASVTNVKAAPYLITSIAIRGNWPKMNIELLAAAQSRAEKEIGNGHVDQIIMNAITPHLSGTV